MLKVLGPALFELGPTAVARDAESMHLHFVLPVIFKGRVTCLTTQAKVEQAVVQGRVGMPEMQC